MSDEIPALLKPLCPSVGELWLWEPEKPHARQFLRVTDVGWNGEEVWVESELVDFIVGQVEVRTGQVYPNELSRWIEATVLVEPSSSDLGDTQP